jgi:DNA-binding response OmpR family regulator
MATLLLVDDDEDLSESLKDLFEMHEHSVDVAGDGSSSLALIKSKVYDLIMLDWQLPDMQGIEVCKIYRTAGGLAPVLLLSGMRDSASHEVGLRAGATSFLTKPFTVDQLVERVQLLLA